VERDDKTDGWQLCKADTSQTLKCLLNIAIDITTYNKCLFEAAHLMWVNQKTRPVYSCPPQPVNNLFF